MNTKKYSTWSRREFLRGLTIASGAGLLGLQPKVSEAEPPPETTTIRLIFDPEIPVLCYAPTYVAEQFLQLEGFTDVRYVAYAPPDFMETSMLAGNEADIAPMFNTDLIHAIDREMPVVGLSGLHAGCILVFGNDQVRTIGELKNKRVAVFSLGGTSHRFLSSMVAYIGLDPNRDIKWVVANPSEWSRMLVEGEVDAFHTVPPFGYDIQARKIGHIILNTTTDNPWRHYFCCMIGARREFIQKYPIATKRALRAILKANQLCSLESDRTARWLMNKGFASNYDYALQTLQEVQYSAWRDYDPDDTLRFFSLRLHEVGMIQHTPQEIIALGTDWRFLNELKQELKA